MEGQSHGRQDGRIGWNTALTTEEVEAIRESVNRGTPFGREVWKQRTVRRLGLEASMNPRGRPRKDS